MEELDLGRLAIENIFDVPVQTDNRSVRESSRFARCPE